MTTVPSDPSRPGRRSIRLPGYDYTQAGAYFVTICTQEKALLFEDPILRSVAEEMWQRIPNHFPHVQVDAWVVMPNHVHGILIITSDAGRGEALRAGEPPARNASPLPRPAGVAPGSLGAIVGNFKSVTARRINRLRGTPGAPVWQRNYYEHIVRDEHALNAIRQYVVDNPARWAFDTYNPGAAGPDPRASELWRLLHG